MSEADIAVLKMRVDSIETQLSERRRQTDAIEEKLDTVLMYMSRMTGFAAGVSATVAGLVAAITHLFGKVG